MQLYIKDLEIYQNKDFVVLKNLLSNYTKRAYFVGGFSRDIFLKHQSSDIDIEVYDINQELFDEIMVKIGASGAGKTFFVYKFKNFDISLPRLENKISYGHSGFDVYVCNNEKQAAKRRDFTINSIMINIFDGSVLDFYGGINDINTRTIKAVNQNSFIEDSLRVLRGISFVCRLNFVIDNSTLNLMKIMDISDLSINRISQELIKIFRSKYPQNAIKIMHELNIFEYIFGIKIDKKKCNFIYKQIQNARRYVDDERLFLFVLAGNLNLNIKELLKKFKLSKLYASLNYHPFISNPTIYDLCNIAIKLPIKQWLGRYNQQAVIIAKQFNIYDKKLHLSLNQELIKKYLKESKNPKQDILNLINSNIKDYIYSTAQKHR